MHQYQIFPPLLIGIQISDTHSLSCAQSRGQGLTLPHVHIPGVYYASVALCVQGQTAIKLEFNMYQRQLKEGAKG